MQRPTFLRMRVPHFSMRIVATANLRRRVERMLAAGAEPGGAMPSTPADALARAIDESDATPSFGPGSRIGPFELIAVLGEGGSSTVFRAVRDTDGVRQEVALKLLHRSLHSPHARRQFRRERRALTQLQHPGIARLIEGGITETGLAYIALEFVDGEPITVYARETKLDCARAFEIISAGLPRRRIGASRADRASRSETVQRAGYRRRHGEAARLRHRETARQR